MSRTCLVTGATSGIGRSIATEWARRQQMEGGGTILAHYGHDDSAAESLAAECSAYDVAVVPLKADLSTREGVRSLVKAVSNSGLVVDDLILNVGIGLYKTLSEYTFDEWEHVMFTNLTAPIFLVKDLAPNMRANGSIVLMSSYAGIEPYSSSLVYSISKAGLAFAAKSLVKELEPYQIRVNALAPGFIETRWQTGRADESRQRINNKIALHRFGLPEEVAKMALDVCSNQYMNGAIVEIHGGYGYF